MWNTIKHSKAARFLKTVAKRVERDVQGRPSVLLIAVVAGAAASFVFNIAVAAIWALFVLFLVYDWDTRAARLLGSISFVFCIVFAFTGDRALFEVAAVYTYFFFGIAAMIWVIKYARAGMVRR